MNYHQKNCIAYVQRWLSAVCSHNLEDVMSKYSKNGILIGTLAETLLIGKPQIRSYFVDFLRKPQLCGEINSAIVQALSPTAFIVSGIYTFVYKEGSNPRSGSCPVIPSSLCMTMVTGKSLTTILPKYRSLGRNSFLNFQDTLGSG